MVVRPDRVMARSTGPLARLRPVAGPLLLALFIASAQVVPALHLATHRDDHTHGPAGEPVDGHVAPSGHDDDRDDAADPRAAAFAGHGRNARPAPAAPAGETSTHRHDGLRPDAPGTAHGHRHGGAGHDHRQAAARPDATGDRHVRDGGAAAPPSGHDHEAPDSDHGRGSSVHFGLALIDGPQPLFLPPPAETLAPASDVRLRPSSPTPLPQPPARGPPASA